MSVVINVHSFPWIWNSLSWKGAVMALFSQALVSGPASLLPYSVFVRLQPFSCLGSRRNAFGLVEPCGGFFQVFN